MDELTVREKMRFNDAVSCHICNKKFRDEKDKKVRDHCHLTGKFRGAAHNSCNLLFRDSTTIPVVFHNLSGYDSHFIITDVATKIKGRMEVLPVNKNRYTAFTKYIENSKISFRFIDSFKFMTSSLDKLSSYLTEFKHLKNEFGHLDEDTLKLLMRKGEFPYEYIDSFEKLQETQLPSKEAFYNKLNDTNISEKNYRHAQNFWSKFEYKTLGDYSDLYMKTDII